MQVFTFTTLFIIAVTAPVEHQDGATSYESLSLGEDSTASHQVFLTLPQYPTAPIYIQKQTPTILKADKHQEKEYAPAHFEFKYAVERHTGDIKSQHEVRNGDEDKGEYSLHEADGTVRTVNYTADKHSGFNAIVERTGHATHPEVVPGKGIHQPLVVHQVLENGNGMGYYHQFH